MNNVNSGAAEFSGREAPLRQAGRAWWRREADVVVVGSGAAGISVALAAAEHGLRVLVVTKDLIGGATPLAQGGLAAALGSGDTPAAHASDTLVAGAGLCEPAEVAALTEAAPGAISWLTGLGAQLETWALRLEGGHGERRIVHSGDDATGAEVHRALLAALLDRGIEILDRTVALDLLLSDTAEDTVEHSAEDPAGRQVSGLAAALVGADGRLTPGVISARAVVVAAGGLGQAFATTSNPAGATGDGIAIAARAGAVIRDLEFVQFHPTVLWLPGATGQCPLITEALRGAGAVLRDLDGTPLMAGHDPRGDLAPRDVIAARMAEVIEAGDTGHVWLDATSFGRDLLENGFPTVTAACRKYGTDPVTDLIPVAPGAHYSCGGILADMDGRTTLSGLYAAGEAASTGVQGANRLASNSVTEAIIAGRRTGAAIAAELAAAPVPARSAETEAVRAAQSKTAPDVKGTARRETAAAMSRWAGVLRDGDGLARLMQLLTAPTAEELAGSGPAAGQVAGIRPAAGQIAGTGEAGVAAVFRDQPGADLDAVETANLRLVSLLIAAGAQQRQESRGCHRRRDAVAPATAAWHTQARWDGQALTLTEEKL